MTYLMLVTALLLSAVAAYYSIFGLTALFAAAVIPIIVMGGILEVAKLVVASWLYRRWKQVNWLMKTYFVSALIVLMFLTSMGIFGFLSKAHLDQALPAGEIVAQIEAIDQKIEVQKQIINDNRVVLKQLDDAVTQILGRSTTEQGAARSAALRKNQTKERATVNATIEKAQTEVNKLLEQRAPIASQLRQVEAEVGPVKYIAALIYGDVADQSLLESAVRIVILLIVFVFDPLAVLMLIAVNSDLKRKQNDRDQKNAKKNQWNEFFEKDANGSDFFPEKTTRKEPSIEKTNDSQTSREEDSGKTKRVWQSNTERNPKRKRGERTLKNVSVAENQESVSVIDWEHNRKLEPVKES